MDCVMMMTLPTYEFVEAFIEDRSSWSSKLVYQIDNSRTVAVIIPDATLAG